MLPPVAVARRRRRVLLALHHGKVVEAVVVVALHLLAVLDLRLALTLAQVRPVQLHQVAARRLLAQLPHRRRGQVVLEEEVVALAVDVLGEVAELGLQRL